MNSLNASLRNRFFLALCGVLTATLLLIALVIRFQLAPILLANEAEHASAELDRVEWAVASELRHLSRTVEDWAWWDDTYNFLRGEQPSYISANLYSDTLDTLNLQLMAFFDSAGQLFWLSGYDPEDGSFSSCPGLVDECAWANELTDIVSDMLVGNALSEQTHSWLMASPEQAMLSLTPIYMSQKDTPSAGWLAMIRPMSPQWLKQVRESTGLDMQLTRVASVNIPLSDTLERISSKFMIAKRRINAIPSSQVLIIEATLPRQRLQDSLETFRYVLYWTLGVLISVLLVVGVLLEAMILAPLRRFATFTNTLRRDEGYRSTPQALLERHDEIGTLAREFQRLLAHQQYQTASLTKLSQHDPLTKLANRRLLNEHLAAMLAKAPEQQHPVAVMMLDIDHFKNYNDHYGHAAGDDVLVTLADTMARHFNRQNQLVARSGGEEFVIVLPGLALERATILAETLRQAIEDLAIPHHPSSPIRTNLTISIGIAVSEPYAPREASELLHAADMALYQAKQAGRNSVHHEQPTAHEN